MAGEEVRGRPSICLYLRQSSRCVGFKSLGQSARCSNWGMEVLAFLLSSDPYAYSQNKERPNYHNDTSGGCNKIASLPLQTRNRSSCDTYCRDTDYASDEQRHHEDEDCRSKKRNQYQEDGDHCRERAIHDQLKWRSLKKLLTNKLNLIVVGHSMYIHKPPGLLLHLSRIRRRVNDRLGCPQQNACAGRRLVGEESPLLGSNPQDDS